MTTLSPEDASMLAILASNPDTPDWAEFVATIKDKEIAAKAALLILGKIGEADVPHAAQTLAHGIQQWARNNDTVNALVEA